MDDELREVWAEWRITLERIVDVGDRVVSIATARGRGRGSGVETEVRSASIWTLLNGRVTRVEIGVDPDEALKAVVWRIRRCHSRMSSSCAPRSTGTARRSCEPST